MISEGLLWFDDDPRRPFSAKVVEAARRFSERTGWAPTACEVNPQTLAQFRPPAPASATPKARRGARAKAAALQDEEVAALRLRMTANPSLRPNHILVGIEVGKTPHPARKERHTRKPAARGHATPAATPRLSA